MLTCYKEEAKAFANIRRRYYNNDEPPVPPATRCRMRRGGGRCRGAASEVSIAQMCAYHQARHVGDFNVDGMRQMAVSNPRLFQRVFE